MKLTVSPGGPSPGSYLADFDGVEPTMHEQFGPGLRWRFRVVDGPQSGSIASRVTGQRPTPGSGCGMTLAALLGRPLVANEEIDVESLIGRRYMITVAPTSKGYGRVQAIMMMPVAPLSPPMASPPYPPTLLPDSPTTSPAPAGG